MGRDTTSLQSQPVVVVLLPERFRAGCAFGGGFHTVVPLSPTTALVEGELYLLTVALSPLFKLSQNRRLPEHIEMALLEKLEQRYRLLHPKALYVVETDVV